MKLNLRDLFWLIFVAAVFCAWWLDRGRLNREIEDLEETIFNISPAMPRQDIDL